MGLEEPASLSVGQTSEQPWTLSFFFLIFIFICLCQVSVAACRIINLRYGLQDLLVTAYGIKFPKQGLNPGPPELGAWSLSHWRTREVPASLKPYHVPSHSLSQPFLCRQRACSSAFLPGAGSGAGREMEGVPISLVSYHLQPLAQLCWPPCWPSCQQDLPKLPGASDVGSPLQAALSSSSPAMGGSSVPGTA